MSVPQNSTFKYTDLNVTPFVVKPYAANGPMSPATSTLYSTTDGVSAVSANSSLVFIGRGTPNYGEVVQSNLMYLMEHFANRSRPMFPTMGQIWYKKQDYTDPQYPADPTTKGLYIWNGLAWDAISMRGSVSPEINMDGNRIRNLGDAISATDALNLRTAESRFVKVTGSDLEGSFFLLDGSIHADPGARISVSDFPADGSHVVNLSYLTVVSNSLEAMIDAVDQRIDNIELTGGVYAPTSGATFTGNVVLSSASTLIAQSGGPALQLNGRSIEDLNLAPVNDSDATSKQYVDTGDQTNATAITALQSTVASTYAALTGASFTGAVNLSSAASLTLAVGGSASFGFRRLTNVGAPLQSADAATKDYVDTLHTKPTYRHVFEQTGTATVVTLPGRMKYTVSSNKLHVYVNGTKQVANTPGTAIVTITGIGLSDTSIPSLTASTTYSVDVTVDGGAPITLEIDVPAQQVNYNGLVALLNTEAVAQSADVKFEVFAYSATEIEIVATSLSTGSTSAVTLSYAAGSLFEEITGSSAPVSYAGSTFDYAEVGDGGTTSTSFEFTSAPTIGDVVEVLLTR